MNLPGSHLPRLPSIIAVDGPAASGKSTVGKGLAGALFYLFFDTGVMYRAVAWAVRQKQIDIHDELAVTRLSEALAIDVKPPSREDGRANDVLADGIDVTWGIRERDVDATVSIIAAYPGVRSSLSRQQRAIGQRGKVVMIGRDIGTVVLPEADLKIYLDASVEVRARRRTDEILSRGGNATYPEILDSMRKRDEIDARRAVAPLRPAEDAFIINSDQLTSGQVIERILGIIRDRF